MKNNTLLGFIPFASFALLAPLLLTHESQAIQFEVIGRGGEILYKGDHHANLAVSIGEITLTILEQARATDKITSYKGSPRSLLAINDLQTDGLDEYEVLSDEEMKAYGWCFSVDGTIPEAMPDQVFFETNNASLRWFYAYAHYLKGKWDWCIPAKSSRTGKPRPLGRGGTRSDKGTECKLRPDIPAPQHSCWG